MGLPKDVSEIFKLTVFAIAAFAAMFVTVLWTKAGFPVLRPNITPTQASSSIPTFGQVQDRFKHEINVADHTNQGDNDAGRDALRLAALQAAQSYSLSSCDRTMRTNLIRDLTAYAAASVEKSGCKPIPCGGSARVSMAAAMFSTPYDMRVREAVADAFSKGGVTVDDFPKPVSLHVAMIAGDRGERESACDVSRQSSTRPSQRDQR